MGILRLLLALSVAIDHFGGVFGFRMGPGSAEVEAFFVISGFYMYLVLHERYYATGVKSFYIARYFRLLPTYLVVLAATVAFLSLSGTSQKFGMTIDQWTSRIAAADPIFAGYAVLSNVLILFNDLFMFLGFDGGSAHWTKHFNDSPVPAYEFLWIPQSWSLGVELAFYIVAPSLLLNARRMALAVTLSLGVCLALRAMGFPYDPFGHRLFPAVLYLFLMGALSCWFWRGRDSTERTRMAGWTALGFLSAWMLAWHYLPFSVEVKKYVLLCVTAATLGPIFALTRQLKWDNVLGELSYPIYVVHLLALAVAGVAAASWVNELALAITVAASIGLVVVIERPAETWRKKLSARFANQSSFRKEVTIASRDF
jgi:peptidoglycan/LPS O-acetylase OafA/YrhL